MVICEATAIDSLNIVYLLLLHRQQTTTLSLYVMNTHLQYIRLVTLTHPVISSRFVSYSSFHLMFLALSITLNLLSASPVSTVKLF